MFAFLSEFLQKKQITTFAALPLSSCRITRPYLLERVGIAEGNVLMLAVPYLTPDANAPDRNLSAYAVSRDYHRFFEALFRALLQELNTRFPQYRHAAFADHSPIDEVAAGAMAGLGVIGANHLLITEKYASYVFLGEVITTAPLPTAVYEIRTCQNCGACQAACPTLTKRLPCLSALTQEKREMSDAELALLRAHPLVWGCDLCQEVCPYTKAARARGEIYSPIPFFHEAPIAHLELAALDAMSDEEFCARAYAWRGRPTVRRNLMIKEKGEPSC